MKKIPIYLLSVVIAYALFGFYAIPYILVNIAPKKIQEFTKSQVCEIQKATFNPFSFELTLQNIKLSTPKNGELAKIEEFYFDFNPIDTIFHKKIFIENISINTPSANLIKYENGTFNFSYLLALGDKKEEKEKSNEPLNLHIKSLKIKNATVQYIDKNSAQKLDSVIKIFDISLLNFDTTKEFQNLLNLTLAGSLETKGFIDVKSKFTLALDGRFDQKELETFKFNVKNFSFGVDEVTFIDRSPKKPYKLDIQKIQLTSKDFNSKFDTPLWIQISTNQTQISELSTNKKLFFLDKILLDIEKLNLKKQHILISQIILSNPSLALTRVSSGKIDLQDFIPNTTKPKETPSQKTKKSNNLWEYEIKKIVLQNGEFDFYDELPTPKVTFLFKNTHFEINGFSSNTSKNITFDFNTHLNQTTKIALGATAQLSTLDANGIFEFEKIQLPLFHPYGKEFSYIEPKKGNISTNGKFEYLDKKITVAGKIALDDWLINDTRDNSVLFGWNKIGVTPFKYTQKNNSLQIKQLNIDGLYTNIHLDKSKKLNFNGLVKNTTQENKNRENNQTLDKSQKQEVAKNSFAFDLQKLYIQKSSANFSDVSLPIPFKTYIHNLNGVIENISSSTDRNATLSLKGGVDDIGTANINGKVYVANPKDFAKIKVLFENLELKQYTPYSMEFLGYEIDDGRLFLNLDYNLANNILQSSNIVSINHIKLGKEKEGGSPWPLGLAVAVLEDSDGIIHLDLPIEGDVNAPDFKYGKIVWKTIGNVFTKIITSPFKLFSSMLGLGDDTIENVDFRYADATLMPSQLKKLDSVASILKKRKKLKLSLMSQYDSVADTRALQIQKLLANASKIESSNMELESIEGISLEIAEKLATLKAIHSQKEKEELATKYKDEKELEENYRIFLIERLLEKEVISKDELEKLAQDRAKSISNYLEIQHQIRDIVLEKSEQIEQKEKEIKSETVKVKLNLIQK